MGSLLWRSRWAAIGAAVAVSFGAGSVFTSQADAPTQQLTFETIAPERILDTRINIGLTGAFTSPVSRELKVTGTITTTTGVKEVMPTGTVAMAVNVTVVSPSAGGFLTIRAAGSAGAPTTSIINFSAGDTISNSAIVTLPVMTADDGEIEITYSAYGASGPTAHILIDVVGWYANFGP